MNGKYLMATLYLETQRVFFGVLGGLVFPWILASMLIRDPGRSTQESNNEKYHASYVVPLWVHLRGSASTALAWGAETMVYIGELSPVPSLLTSLFRYQYPSNFQPVSIPVASEKYPLALSCQVALQSNTGNPNVRMTIILVPGMFNTASMSIIISIATQIYNDWGANVIVTEMRGHGETGRKYPEVPPSLTVLEANDLLEVARYAKTHYDSQNIYLIGISLGGTCALSAAVQDKDQGESLIQACTILSSPIDLQGLIDHLSAPCSITSLNVWYAFYSWLLARYCRLRGLGHIRTFRQYVDTVIEPYYRDQSTVFQTTTDKVSPIYRLENLSTPILALYSKDDPVASMSEPALLYRKAKACQKESFLRLEIMEHGGHAGQFWVDNAGTSQLIQDFFQQHMSKPTKPQ
jgi:predicted alpha/beta-fold hydrolase